MKTQTQAKQSLMARQAQAEWNTVNMLVEQHNIDTVSAQAIFDLYYKHDLWEYDFTNTRYTAKHGSLLDKEQIQRMYRKVNLIH